MVCMAASRVGSVKECLTSKSFWMRVGKDSVMFLSVDVDMLYWIVSSRLGVLAAGLE